MVTPEIASIYPQKVNMTNLRNAVRVNKIVNRHLADADVQRTLRDLLIDQAIYGYSIVARQGKKK